MYFERNSLKNKNQNIRSDLLHMHSIGKFSCGMRVFSVTSHVNFSNSVLKNWKNVTVQQSKSIWQIRDYVRWKMKSGIVYSFCSDPEDEWKNSQRVLKILPLIFGSETSKQVKWVRNVRVDYTFLCLTGQVFWSTHKSVKRFKVSRKEFFIILNVIINIYPEFLTKF